MYLLSCVQVQKCTHSVSVWCWGLTRRPEHARQEVYHWIKLRAKIFFFLFSKKKLPYYRSVQKLDFGTSISLHGAEKWTIFLVDVSFNSHQVSRTLKIARTLTSSAHTPVLLHKLLHVCSFGLLQGHFCFRFALSFLPWRPLPSRLLSISVMARESRCSLPSHNLSLICWTHILKADNVYRYKWLFAFILKHGLTLPPVF